MQDPKKLDCTQIGEMLGAFRDLELELSQVEIVEDHLAACAGCRREMAAIDMVIASLKSLPELPVRDFADAIEARINESLQQSLKIDSAKAPSQNKQPALAVAGDNMRPFSQQSGSLRRPLRRPLMAVAALLLFGFVAAVTLTPRLTQMAQVHPSASSAQFPNKRFEADKGGAPISDDIVALYDEEGANNVSDAGISTNEDGLYAIKM